MTPCAAARADATRLHFHVSLNEEHVFLDIALAPDAQIGLGERVHHYSLLTLARLRLADARRGLDASCQGWVDVGCLSQMLGLDSSHLNIQIHRARHQFAQALPSQAQAAAIVERRRGEIRFGALAFKITRGGSVEGEFPLPL